LSEVCPFRSTRRARLKIGLARRSLIGSARLRKSQARYFAISVAERRARPAAAFHLRSQWRLRIRIPIPMSNSWRAEVAIEEFRQVDVCSEPTAFSGTGLRVFQAWWAERVPAESRSLASLG
jgi:hypothetical protein